MSVFKKILSVVLCLAMMIACLAGCGEKTEDAIIYFELLEKPHTLDPQKAQSDSELMIVRNIFEGLMRETPNGEIVCGASKSYTYESLTYTFKLKDDAVWSNGDKLTAQDFVFGLQRAVDPKIKAPFVSRLYSIVNAKEINQGNADVSSLGVKALNDTTVQITLCEEDKDFLKTLSTSVAMPCNQKFFEDSIGKYGLSAECVISNGSYRLTKWNKEEDFGIRLYKNEALTGFFEAKNAAVFISCVEDETQLLRLTDQKSDMAFITGTELSSVQNAGFLIQGTQNTTWVMTINGDFTPEMRQAFAMAISPSVYEKSLPASFAAAKSIYPASLGISADGVGVAEYNLEEAKALLSKQVSQLPDGKFPSATLYYYDTDGTKNLATSIVGHWQQNLGTFINIEPTKDVAKIQQELKSGTLQFALFPVTATSDLYDEYVTLFVDENTSSTPLDFQKELLQQHNIIPIAYQTTNVTYIPSLKNVSLKNDNGYIDFYNVIKIK